MKKILVVDDNLMNRKMAEKVLKGTYEVALAESGEEALAKLPEFHPDLILLDVLMPEMDGFETLDRMKEQEGFSGTPVVFLTADGDESTRERALQAGARNVIGKPFRKEELLSKVAEQLV